MSGVAVVTGAGRGIGREIARRLVDRGLTVLVTDVDEGLAQETAAALGPAAWARQLDVRDPEQHRAAAAEAAARGPVVAWFNNAGVLRTEKAWEHPDADVRLMVEVNVLGVIHGSRAAVDVMRSGGVNGRRRHIVNIGSLSALGPVPGLAVYSATKHAVLGFTASLAGDLRLAGLPIRVHALNPDTVDTDMVRERERDPESALIFTAPRLLDAGRVAEEAVALLDSRRIVRTVPGWRGAIARSAAPVPSLGLPILGALRRLGERERRSRL